MILEYLLVALCRTPSSGYDLGAVFKAALWFFWPAELSQVYPTLKRLERRRWLKARTVPSARGPARRVYETTERGRDALAAWLAQGPAFREERYVVAAQVFVLDAAGGPDASAAFVGRLRDSLTERAAALAAVDDHVKVADLSDAEFHHYLSLRLGRRVVEARLSWCREALEALAARTSRAKGKPNRPIGRREGTVAGPPRADRQGKFRDEQVNGRKSWNRGRQ